MCSKKGVLMKDSWKNWLVSYHLIPQVYIQKIHIKLQIISQDMPLEALKAFKALANGKIMGIKDKYRLCQPSFMPSNHKSHCQKLYCAKLWVACGILGNLINWHSRLSSKVQVSMLGQLQGLRKYGFLVPINSTVQSDMQEHFYHYRRVSLVMVLVVFVPG